MTDDPNTAPVQPVELYEALVERLNGEWFEVIAEPTGWICRQCDGRFARSEPTPPPRWALEQIVESIVDAADYHLRGDHPAIFNG